MRAPICHNRAMWAVVSNRTDLNAYDRNQDTPVWWCPECRRKIKREVDPSKKIKREVK